MLKIEYMSIKIKKMRKVGGTFLTLTSLLRE